MLNIAKGLKSTTAEIQVSIRQRRQSSTEVPTRSCCGLTGPASCQSRIAGSISPSQSKRLKQTQQELLPLRRRIEAIRCFLQVLWSCLVWIASSRTSGMLSVLPRGKAVGPGPQPATWQQLVSLTHLAPGKEGFLLTLEF